MGKLLDRARRSFEGSAVSSLESKSRLIRRLALWQAWFAVFIIWSALVVTVGPIPRLTSFHAEVGEKWVEQDVFTPFALSVDDVERALAEQSFLRAQHEKVFVYDPEVEAGSFRLIDQILSDAVKAKEAGTSVSELVKAIQTERGIDLSHRVASFLIAHADDHRLRSDLAEALRVLYKERGVTNDKRLLIGAAQARRLKIILPSGRQDLDTTFSVESVIEYPGEVREFLQRRAFAKVVIAPEWRDAYAELLLQVLRPNLVYSEKLTAEFLASAMKRAEHKFHIEPGARVVAQGDRLSLLQVSLLKLLDQKLRHYDTVRLIINAVLLFLGMALVIEFARKYDENFQFTSQRIFVTWLPTIFALAVAKFLLFQSSDVLLSTFALPAGLVGMLGVILLDRRVAVVVSFVTALAAGLAFQWNFLPTLVTAISSLAGIFFIASVRERREVLLAGVKLTALNVLLVLLVNLAQAQTTLRTDLILVAIANGLGCYVMAVGSLPLVESLFDIVTDVRLMELTSVNHPLMRLLEERAPGSYQHVLNVTKLAEPAAERIGANFLLVRAGAYFHDVGKILKPKYFTENQVTPEERRIHSRLSPHLSCLIIKNHVREGIELAQRFGLPQQVIDFIPQHHGTCLIRYFYEVARQQAEAAGTTIDEREFLYPGPKPQTREAAIVMLADAVEATATAKFTGSIIREEDVYRVVRQTIQDKFSEGQFDECPMTFKDLHEIFEVFVKTLLSRYHRRVDYPQAGQTREQKPGTVIAPPVPAAAPAASAGENRG